VWVIVLSTVTLFVYAWFWWYFINRELRDLGRARGSTELGDNPGLSVLAVSLGSLVLVPPFVSLYGTSKRVQAAQRLTGEREQLNGWLLLVLTVLWVVTTTLLIPFMFGYVQSELNKVWRNQEVTDPIAPGLLHPGAQAAVPSAGRGAGDARKLVPRSLEPGPSAVLGWELLDWPHGCLSSVPTATAKRLR
jgi:hypothetical protein